MIDLSKESEENKMEIINKDKDEIPFSTLTYGDCFLYNDEVFIKIIQLKDPSDNSEWNCVKLKTGAVYFMEDDDYVVEVNCKLEYSI